MQKQLILTVRDNLAYIDVRHEGALLGSFEMPLSTVATCDDPNTLLNDVRQAHPDLDQVTVDKFVRRLTQMKPRLQAMQATSESQARVDARAKKLANQEAHQRDGS